jgi:hypothetical protein
MRTTSEVAEGTYIYDIETFDAIGLFGFKKVGLEEWHWFEISDYKNELDGLVKWLTDYPKEYIAGFNNIAFDGQVIQYILDTYHVWTSCSAREIVSFIAGFASNVISNQNYDIKPVYPEKYMDIAQIDL